MSEDASMPVASSPSSGNIGGGRGGGGSNNRRQGNRNQNRNASKSKSRSPSHDGMEGRRNQRKGSKSRSPTRHNNKSRSPTRQNNKSRSPTRRQGNGHNHNHFHHPQYYRDKKFSKHAAAMTIVVKRSDLWDSAAHFQPDENLQLQVHIPDCIVAPYHFAPDIAHLLDPSQKQAPGPQTVCVARVPHSFEKSNLPMQNENWQNCDVIDTSNKNPHDPNVVMDKYWAQRRRLFSRFDQGIQLDPEGWYSVTPEIIADHVAHRVATLASSIRESDDQGIVILDAFCGCGGNSIAFGKVPHHLISKVICVDTDRSKLMKAARNASLYDIPRDKLLFVECNSAFILQHCYKDGQFVLDQPSATMPAHMPKPVMSTIHAGYHVGGIDMLPRRVDAVFMDPPWGGVDYEVLGKNGYDLQKNMKIQVASAVEPEVEGVCDDFFDTFSSAPQKTNRSQKARKANFNKKTEGLFIDGMELLKVAAEATSSRLVVYDLPRNTNKTSLGKCALGAGYRGNVKLEEHYLNGRLKTVTAYMGADYSSLINDLHESPSADNAESLDSTADASCESQA
jgi:trimethylguanosine synthase